MPGIALICALDGTTREVVRDDLETGILPGRPLAERVAPGSLEKAERLLAAITDEGAAFNWEIDLLLDERATLSFAGTRYGDDLLLIGAALLDDVFELYEELALVNNEQTNLLRRAIKDQVLIARRQTEIVPLEELARINNEMANLQRELARKNRQLERLNEQKNAFLGMAAHDLRNPISSVGGYAKLLLEVEMDPEGRRRALESISRVASGMLELVNDLLDVSVIESGKLELRPERVDLRRLLEERVRFFRALAEQKEIELVSELREVSCELDPGRIEQVIDNLVSNAVKYSPQRSRVTVSLLQDERRVRLAVRDEGPGLSGEDQERLFGAFQRLGPRPTGGEKSTGLGLAISKRIIAAHGGAIEVQSAPGEGSLFSVVLPAATGEEPA